MNEGGRASGRRREPKAMRTRAQRVATRRQPRRSSRLCRANKGVVSEANGTRRASRLLMPFLVWSHSNRPRALAAGGCGRGDLGKHSRISVLATGRRPATAARNGWSQGRYRCRVSPAWSGDALRPVSQEPDADGANPVFGFVAVSEPLGAQRLAGLHPWWRQGHTGRASGPSQHGDAVPAASAAVPRWVSISEQQAASAAVPTVRAGAVVSWVRCPRVSAPERVDGIGEGPTRTRNRSGPGANRPRWPKATSTVAGSVKSLSFPRCGGESRPRVSAGGAALGNRLGHRPAAALRGRPSRARSRPAAGISQTCHCPARRAPKPRRRRLRGVIRPPGDVTAPAAVHGSAARLSGWRDQGCERSLRVGSDGPAGPLHRLVETPCGLPA